MTHKVIDISGREGEIKVSVKITRYIMELYLCFN